MDDKKLINEVARFLSELTADNLHDEYIRPEQIRNFLFNVFRCMNPDELEPVKETFDILNIAESYYKKPPKFCYDPGSDYWTFENCIGQAYCDHLDGKIKENEKQNAQPAHNQQDLKRRNVKMSDIYIKMVLALPDEFFKDWEWEEGDHLLHKELGSEQWYEKTIGELEVSRNTILYRVVDYHDTLEGEIRPLPSQRQLQEISGLDWDLYYHDIVKNYSEYDSAEQAGLARVMYVKYHKKWDGETWI